MADTFGSRLRELRKEGRILQSQFAETCGISSAYLSDIERGKRNPPEDRVILQWAEYLDSSQAEEIGAALLELAAFDRGSLRPAVERDEIAVEVSGAMAVRPQGEQKKEALFLDYFCADLTALARRGDLDEARERSRDFDAIAQATARMQGNSVLLMHCNGREIARVAHGLICEITQGRTPTHLSGKRVFALGHGKPSMMAGVKYRGQLEERVDNLIRESQQAGDIVLYVASLLDLADLEVHTKGTLLIPALQNADIQVIAGATEAAMAYGQKVCPDLVDCFSKVQIAALDMQGVLQGIFSVRDRYSAYHGVTYADSALEAIVDAVKSAGDAGCWQRAMDLMDDIGARAKVEAWTGEISVEDVTRTVGEMAEVG